MKSSGTFGPGARGALLLLGVAAFLAHPVPEVEAQSLRGSQASLDRQNAQARAHDFTYLRTAQDVRRLVELGYLVAVAPNRDFDVHNVSFPYARPEVRLFIERLASQYRGACGEKLVVTSLTRPIQNQPRNASSRSVHPTGMAVDLRRSGNARCRQWLESTLLSLEGQGILEAIYERNPPHYHVALYPRPYAQHVARVTGSARVVAQAADRGEGLELQWVTHRVSRGETLTGIANRYGTAVARIQAENRLSGHRILAGQELRIPVYQEVPSSAPARAASAPTRTASAASFSGRAGAAAGPADEGDGASSDGSVHVVARGESLWSISRRYGVSEPALRAANDLTGSRIVVGQRLRLPAEGEAPSSLRHRVSPGESLWSIARAHRITVDQIRRANGISSSRIYAGQVLEIPLSY